MAVTYATIANAVTNITAALPIIQDSFIYAANFFVEHPIGVIVLTMGLFAFGIKMVAGLVRGRRGRR